MAEAFGGMAISGAILLGVVLVVVVVSYVAVRRGEAAMHEQAKQSGHGTHGH